MDGPKCGREDGRPELPYQPRHQKKYQQHVSRVQQEVQPVIAGRAIAIAEYRVVEQVRQGGNRAIKTGFAMRPPIGVLKNEIQVLRRGLPYARVLQDQRFVVQREAGAEGIRIGQQSGGTESDRDQQAAPAVCSLARGIQAPGVSRLLPG